MHADADDPVRTAPPTPTALLASLGDVVEAARVRVQACLCAAERLTDEPPQEERRRFRARLDALDAEVEAAEAAGDLVGLVRAVAAREALLDDVRALLGLRRPGDAPSPTAADSRPGRVPAG